MHVLKSAWAKEIQVIHRANTPENCDHQALLMSSSKKTKPPTKSLIACFGAAASVGLVSPGQVAADIVYSGPQNLTMNVGDSLAVDFNADGQDDFSFFFTGGSTSRSMFVFGTNGQNSMAYVETPLSSASSVFGVRRFSLGNSISDLVANFRQSNYLFWVDTAGSVYADPWNVLNEGSVTDFAGFQVEDAYNGTRHFGWARISISVEANGLPLQVTIRDWAYEDNPDSAIAAGQIPEPSSIAALAILSLGAAGIRFRKTRAKQK